MPNPRFAWTIVNALKFPFFLSSWLLLSLHPLRSAAQQWSPAVLQSVRQFLARTEALASALILACIGESTISAASVTVIIEQGTCLNVLPTFKLDKTLECKAVADQAIKAAAASDSPLFPNSSSSGVTLSYLPDLPSSAKVLDGCLPLQKILVVCLLLPSVQKPQTLSQCLPTILMLFT